MVGYNHSMESIWTGPWNPYRLVHGIHMNWFMESISTGSWNPYELVHGIHMDWFMELIAWFMESTWNGDVIHMGWTIP
jgi:hypothetical protein